MFAKSLELHFLGRLCNLIVLRSGVYREENKMSVVINYKVVIDGGDKL